MDRGTRTGQDAASRMGRLSSSRSNTEYLRHTDVLNDNVEHHAEEEKEGKMFTKVRQLIDRAELEELEKELEEAKHKRSGKASWLLSWRITLQSHDHAIGYRTHFFLGTFDR